MKTLTVFDLDDTLFTSPGKVYIRNIDDPDYRKEVTSSMTETLEPGEYFDYSDFRNAQLFFDLAKPIVKMVNKFNKIVHERDEGSQVCIITARADLDERDVFIAALQRYNAYHEDVYIWRAGNFEDKAPTTALRKAWIVDSLIDKYNFEKVVMFDDAYPNLRAMLSLQEQFSNVFFEVYHVNHKAKVTRFHG